MTHQLGPCEKIPRRSTWGGDPGSHTVRLGGVATNCAVAGETTRDINIASGQATAVTFQISCSPSMGTLVITSSTNGISLDPDGYRVELNGFDAGALGVTAELRLNRVAAGAHYVRLAKVADNCRVKDNPRQVSLIGSQELHVAFEVTCARAFRIVDLGTIPGEDASQAYAISPQGVVVGQSQGIYAPTGVPLTSAFIWQEGVMRALEVPSYVGFENNVAFAVNSKLQIVGTLGLDGGEHLAFLWEEGHPIEIRTSGCIEKFSFAFGINDAGQVVGDMLACNEKDFPTSVAFFWDSKLRTPATGREGTARAINSAGQIVGGLQHAVRWDASGIADLGTLGGDRSIAQAINDAGQIVGSGWLPGSVLEDPQQHAFLWENGVMKDLGTLGDGYSSVAYGINASGQVVGTSKEGPNSPERAFLWERGFMTDLGTLGGLKSVARGINDAGQIVGWSETASGETHATLWVPQ
jgi:probable HAF family extracellular repeat protein